MQNDESSDATQKLSDVLNIDPSENTPKQLVASADTSEQPIVAGTTAKNSDSDEDYNTVRKNLKKLILTSEIAIEGILNVADEGDSPRAYEVVSDLIKTALDANNRLMDLHKTVKDINKEETKTKGDTVTNNSIYVGNTSDLLKMIRQKKMVLPENTTNIENDQ
jgi:hypothetical protein